MLLFWAQRKMLFLDNFLPPEGRELVLKTGKSILLMTLDGGWTRFIGSMNLRLRSLKPDLTFFSFLILSDPNGS